MRKTIAICTWAALLAATAASAQESPQPKEPDKTPGKRLRVEFRETRQRGQSTTTTQLASLALHADAGSARVFAGTQVRYTVADRDAPTTTLKNAGFDGRVTVTTLPDGRYRVDARFEKASVLAPSAGAAAPGNGDNPVLQGVLKGESKLTVREGETVPFASAVDPVTGEVVRIDVTVTAPPAPKRGSAAGGADARLRALLVLTRRQGEKTTARRPYSVTLQAGGEGTSRVFGGSMLPVQTEIQGKAGVALRDVGAGLKVGAQQISDGRYRLDVSFTDGVLGEGEDAPQIRTFDSDSQVFVQQGETLTIASAVDPQTGEVVEAEVTLEGVK